MPISNQKVLIATIVVTLLLFLLVAFTSGALCIVLGLISKWLCLSFDWHTVTFCLVGVAREERLTEFQMAEKANLGD